MIVVVAVALHRVWEIGILLAFSRRFLSWPADAVFPAPHQVAVVVDRSRHSLAARRVAHIIFGVAGGPAFREQNHESGCPILRVLCEEPALSGVEGVGGRLIAL